VSNKFKKSLAVAMGLALAGAAAFSVAQAQTAAAWGTLLNGTNGMDNFNQTGNANWRVMEDGIGANLGNGHLVTKESYADFRIVAEIWTDGPANSGIFIRCQNPNNIGAGSCYEVNVFDTRPGQEYATGGIVDTARVIGGPHRAAGKWNTLEINAKGPQLTVMFNGVKTSEATDSKHARGRISLQYGGGLVKFRKFEIQPL
jgi:Domain of Unknown Function (DUF1080)